ncbi:hypothetical protein LBMAG53_15400 [Planctomycetota bacterium]|nr:hypothetical protein LBMAG53_15400 [Planctomycetota bacterium]
MFASFRHKAVHHESDLFRVLRCGLEFGMLPFGMLSCVGWPIKAAPPFQEFIHGMNLDGLGIALRSLIGGGFA